MEQITVTLSGPNATTDALIEKIKLVFPNINLQPSRVSDACTLHITKDTTTKDYALSIDGNFEYLFAEVAGIIFQATGGTVIAIDGTSGCGKGTLAKMMADQFHGLHLDSGLLYRAVTYELGIKQGLEPTDRAVPKQLDQLVQTFDPEQIMIHEPSLRTPEIDRIISAWSMIPIVRQAIFWLEMRVYNSGKSYIVAEGRDMAASVFPKAQHKFFIDCPIEERARRRSLQNKKPIEETLAALRARDTIDGTRSINPLRYRPDLGVILIQNTAPPQETFQIMLKNIQTTV